MTQTDTQARGAREIRRKRRRESIANAWREYANDRGGLIGLGLLVLIVLLAALAPVLGDESALDVTESGGTPRQAPSGEYWLGTDRDGISVLVLLWWGARISLLVGLSAALLSVLIGTAVGVLAAHFGGWFSAVLMRLTDFVLVLPTLVLAIALSAVLPRGIGTIILAIGIASWPTTARLARAQTLTIEARPYIERSKALGAGHAHVIFKHVLPAVLPLVFAHTTLVVANSIIAESTLSFLGVGDPNEPSWGGILQAAFSSGAVSQGAWWYLMPPGVAIVVVVLCFTLCGRALETVLNPTLRGRK